MKSYRECGGYRAGHAPWGKCKASRSSSKTAFSINHWQESIRRFEGEARCKWERVSDIEGVPSTHSSGVVRVARSSGWCCVLWGDCRDTDRAESWIVTGNRRAGHRCQVRLNVVYEAAWVSMSYHILSRHAYYVMTWHDKARHALHCIGRCCNIWGTMCLCIYFSLISAAFHAWLYN